MGSGVSEEAVTIIPDEVEAIDAALAMAEPGDLLVIFGDDSARCWKQIIYFNSDDVEADDDSAAATQASSVEFEEVFDSDQTLIRDERGVRLARVDNEEAD